jgi:hypothetical protein
MRYALAVLAQAPPPPAVPTQDLIDQNKATAVGVVLVAVALLGIVAFAAFSLWGQFELKKLAKKAAGMAVILIMLVLALAPAATQTEAGKRVVCTFLKVPALCAA